MIAFVIRAVAVLALLAVSLRGEIEEFIAEPVDGARDRAVPLRFYAADWDDQGEPKPVVLFSHGLGGSRDNNGYLGKQWAASGYVAVFMQHAGSDADVWKSAAPRDRMTALKGAANGRATMDRFADVSFVIDQLEAWNAEEDHPLRGRLDLQRIGMSGHSFGAVTTQGVMGQLYPGGRSVEEPRLKAFVLFSPSSHRTVSSEEAFGHITKPVLCMTGTEDSSPIEQGFDPLTRQAVYAALPEGSAYQLVFEGGEHHAFGDGGRPGRERMDHHHPAILEITTRFWNAYLKGDEEAMAWLQSEAPAKELLKDPNDRWEWK